MKIVLVQHRRGFPVLIKETPVVIEGKRSGVGILQCHHRVPAILAKANREQAVLPQQVIMDGLIHTGQTGDSGKDPNQRHAHLAEVLEHRQDIPHGRAGTGDAIASMPRTGPLAVCRCHPFHINRLITERYRGVHKTTQRPVCKTGKRIRLKNHVAHICQEYVGEEVPSAVKPGIVNKISAAGDVVEMLQMHSTPIKESRIPEERRKNRL